MKKTITLLSIFILTGVCLFSQTNVFNNNLSSWKSAPGSPPTPGGMVGAYTNFPLSDVTQVSTGATYGSSMAKLVLTSATAPKRFTTQAVTVRQGLKYSVKMWVKASQGRIKTGYFDWTNNNIGPFNPVTIDLAVASAGSLVMISQIIEAPVGCKLMDVAMLIDSTDSNGILLDSIAVDEIPSAYKAKSIYEIQYTTSVSGDSPYKDSLVQTRGIVTAKYNKGFWIQDSTVGWHGLFVFDTTAVNIGDFVIVEGKVAEFFNLTELKDVVFVSSIPAGMPIPAAINLTTTTVNDEQYEGMFVQVANTNCVNASAGNGEWYVQNIGEDTAVIDDLIFAYTPTLGDVYGVRGVLHYSFNEYKIEPRDAMDIFNTTSIDEIENLTFSLFPNPVTSKLNIVSDKTVKSYTIYSVSGKLVQSFTSNSIININVSNLDKGIYILKLSSESSVGIKRFIKQ